MAGVIVDWEKYHQSKNRARHKEFYTEFEEANNNDSVETCGVDNFVFGDTKSARNPRKRRDESEESEGPVQVNVMVLRETTGEVYEGVGRLLPQNGEESENHHGQAYVYGGRSK